MRTGNTKERLLEAALDLFSIKGYEGTSVEEIAKRVGIKAPSIYDHYKGKEAILQAISERADEEYTRGMELRRAKAETIRTKEDLREYALRSIGFTINNEIAKKLRRMITIEQFRNKVFSERTTKHQITLFQSIYADIFRKMMEDGLMIKANPEVVALEYTAPVTVLIQLCDRDPERIEEVMKTVEDHLDIFLERYFV